MAKKKVAKKTAAKKTKTKKTAKKNSKKTKKSAASKKVTKKVAKKKTAAKAKKKSQSASKKASSKKTAKKVAKKKTKAVAKKAKSLKKKAAPKKKAAKKVAAKKAVSKKAVSSKAKKASSKANVETDVTKVEKQPKKTKAQRLEEQEEAIDEIDLMAAELALLDEDEDDDVILTDADGNPYCKLRDCDQLAAVDGYCRLHYILLWKRIQNRKKILAGGKLDRYIEELTARYPDKYLEMLRKDLASEKDFMSVVAELDIDEAGDGDMEDDTQAYIDEMRGVMTRDDGNEDEY